MEHNQRLVEFPVGKKQVKNYKVQYGWQLLDVVNAPIHTVLTSPNNSSLRASCLWKDSSEGARGQASCSQPTAKATHAYKCNDDNFTSSARVLR